MKKLIPLLLALLLLPGCASAQAREDSRVTIVCTTYPIYLLACSITQGVEGVRVERLNTGNVSCLHDYALTVGDMRKLEGADVIALNGAGLEDFLEDALAASPAAVIDCSAGVELLESAGHNHEEDHGHDHAHDQWDPHYWMDPDNAQIMARNLRDGLTALDPDYAGEYENGCQRAEESLDACREEAQALLERYLPGGVPGLITFHDGFQYFAHAFGLPLLAAIEEEAGSEASAHEIVEITRLIREYHIPVIFTEVNGSDATAQAIRRETGCAVAQLTMLMDGPDAGDPEFSGVEHYFQLCWNIRNIINGFAGEGTVANG